MNTSRTIFSVRIFILLIFSLCSLWSCTIRPSSEPTKQPLSLIHLRTSKDLQPASNTLAPGLEPWYIDTFYRRIEQMPNHTIIKKMGKKGRPIHQLNHIFAKNVPVFDSGRTQGVGMLLSGYLLLPAPGEYRFQALSNDGIECLLDNTLLFEDPTVHKARLSPVGNVKANVTGWYPIRIRYFQRKGTAALKLYWQPPGTNHFSVIPQVNFTHIKNKKKS